MMADIFTVWQGAIPLATLDNMPVTELIAWHERAVETWDKITASLTP